MSSQATRDREVAVPAAAFSALAEALREQGGSLTAIHGLHAGGYGAGALFYERLAQSASRDPAEMEEREFWRVLRRYMAKKGWGTLSHHALHPGVGLLVSEDWAESEGSRRPQPACAFTVGLLSHLLTRAAKAPIAVLEVSCRGAGNRTCSFAFGSEATIHDLYGLLLEGKGVEQALADL
jgi:hypothetical protein